MSSISKRLNTIADMVGIDPECTVADIGCDHGFLSIELLKRNAAKKVICADVNDGPLSKAKENFSLYGLSDKAEFVISNGFENVNCASVDTAVIAGMGGLLILDIIKNSIGKVKGIKKLVISPQSDIPEVRRFFKKIDFFVSDEKMICDMGKFYTIMVINPSLSSEELNEREIFFGRHLISKMDRVFIEYLNHRVCVLEKIISEIKNSNSNVSLNTKRLSELSDELDNTKEILTYHG